MARSSSAMPAPFALPVAGAALLLLGAGAATARLPSAIVIGSCCVLVAWVAYASERATVVPLLLVAWMTATAFAHAPYGQLRAGARVSAVAAIALSMTGLVALAAAEIEGRMPRRRNKRTLGTVISLAGFASAVDRRRQLLGVAVAAIALPSLTAILATYRSDLSLANDLLFYLVVVMAVTVIGGFWPAIASAVAASLLVNWYFTAPLHTFTIQRPDNLLALLLFVVVAMGVSTVVHLAAIRAAQAARSKNEAAMLLELARTALADEDTPLAVLRHLHERVGIDVELLERAGERWVRVAAAGNGEGVPTRRVRLRDDVQLVARGTLPEGSDRLLDAAAGQVAAALDRDRLRTQAAQTEALAAANRMRTALLAAVSHDLRTPMASIKASISSLLQTDVKWSDEDVAAFLETIGESTDRLDALIANLLDMTRVQTGSLQPFLRPTSVDEVTLRALQGIPGGRRVRVDVPEDLGLVLTDAGLLERALANLLANALRWSPQNFPPVLTAARHNGRVTVSVVDYGPGVPASDRERIFAPFQRLGDQSATTGVGLGLAVARGFVEAVGGTIEVGETPGGGLTMTVSLPASPIDSDIAARETAS